jgi:hypothetical protein
MFPLQGEPSRKLTHREIPLVMSLRISAAGKDACDRANLLLDLFCRVAPDRLAERSATGHVVY